jgi:hypothetical protein
MWGGASSVAHAGLPWKVWLVCMCIVQHVVMRSCVQVFATAPTAHGLMSESFIGPAAPNTAAGAMAGCDNLAAGLDMVAR